MTQRTQLAQEFGFVCPLAGGLHGRPASEFAAVAGEFDCECVLTNLRTGMTANAKSVLSLISADVRKGDQCMLRVSGNDCESALTALQTFVERRLPACDSSGPPKSVPQSFVAPRLLHNAGVTCYFGQSACKGIARGKAVIANGLARPTDLRLQAAGDPHRELERIKRAIGVVVRRIDEKLEHASGLTEAAILKAELSIAQDFSLLDKLTELVASGKSAEHAVLEAAEYFAAKFRRSENELIRERGVDVEEICLQLLHEIRGINGQTLAVTLDGPTVIVAESLAPQQLLTLDRRCWKGLVLEHPGLTSHAVILARSLGIPSVVGVGNARLLLAAGHEIIVDGNRGLVVPVSSPAVETYFEGEMRTVERRKQNRAHMLNGPATTLDGRVMEVASNASSLQEWVLAFEKGADGIGLFRTEMVFLERDHPPSEEEQFLIYKQAAVAAAGKPVIIRTLDLGADKRVAYMNLPEEENPFLGYRGVRMYAEHDDLVQAQLRAILRASAFGRVQIMAPMISSLEEVVRFKADIDRAKQHLSGHGIEFDADIPVGVMIEVPSVAFILGQLCQEVDFFSIGTNDLNQYFLAVDRDNPKISELSNVRHPGFLRFLKHIVDEIHLAGKWVGMCGEMAADIRHLPLLVGLGLDEISLAATDIAEFKRSIAQLSAGQCRQLLERAIACRTTAELDSLVSRERPVNSREALISDATVLLGSESRSKEEAIQEIVDALYVAGRAEDRQELERAVWAREALYTTDFGHGFAVPHCKTDCVEASSVGVLRLKQPVHWGSPGNEPVRMVILMAIRESEASDRHMEIFAKLARKLVADDFRECLLKIDDPHSIVTYLTQQLELPGQTNNA